MTGYEMLLHAVYGPRRPLAAPRCQCLRGPMVDRNDIKHGVLTCFRCGKRPTDRWLARHWLRPR